jgi:predicted nucleic acid-binding protein
VVIIHDTSFIYALSDRQDVRHHEATSWYREDESDLVTTPLVLAEADYLIGDRLGRRARRPATGTTWRAARTWSTGGRARRRRPPGWRSNGPTSGSG